jgi:phage gp36-like protein
MTAKYLTYDEFLIQFDDEDILAVAGIGGFNSAGGRVIDQPRVENIIARAISRVDGYVLARFPVLKDLPAAEMPPALKGAVGDIAFYWLRDREGDKGTVDDVVRTRFQDAIKYLEGIQSGKIDLGFSGANEQPDGTLGGVSGNFPDSRSDAALDGFL